MIDPKYAELPGIAHDQADVYETDDVSENEKIQDYIPDDNDTVEKIYVNASDAFEKFKDKRVDSSRTDFSNSAVKTKLGYNVSCRSWGVFDKNDVETPLEKFHRLKFEINELINEVDAIKKSMKDKEKVKSVSDVINLIEKTEQELDAVDINQFVGKDFISSVLNYQEFHLKELQSHIELFKQKGSTDVALIKDNQAATQKDSSTGLLRYNMIYFPEKAQLYEQTRVINLEKRIGYIESIMGVSQDNNLKYSQLLKSNGIMNTIEGMMAKVSLLNSNQLDTLENKMSSLLHKLDSAVQKTAGQNSEYEKMLTELYPLVKQLQSSSEILPRAIDRMLSLNDIHHKAGEFTKDLKHLDDLQLNITKTLESNLSLLQEVQKNFATNLEVLVKDINFISERIKKLKL